MVREKEGKILWIEPKCYRKVGFEADNGEAVAKMIPDDTFIDFIDSSFDLSEQCVKITQEHKKIDDIRLIDKCSIKKKSYKDIRGF